MSSSLSTPEPPDHPDVPSTGRIRAPVPAVRFHSTRRGILAHFSADQCIGASLERYGEWAEGEIALLRSHIAPGDTVLDVGANVGTHTLAFADMVGPTGKVIAIEGQMATFMLLGHNIVANGFADRVTALPVLAGSGPGLVPSDLGPLTDNAGAKSFFPDVHGRDIHGTPLDRLPAKPKGLPVLLALTTIDSLELERCALIKIDVEGMELDVLRGARDTLRRTRAVVYFEQAAGASSGMRDIHDLMRQAGYRLYWHVTPAYNPLNFRGNTDNIFGDAAETNVVAMPSGMVPPDGLDEVEMP